MSDPLTNQTSIFADKIAVWSEETKGYVEVGTGKANAVDVYSKVAMDALLLTKAPTLNPSFSGTIGGISKSDVGLPLAENTADMAKPVSTATIAALSLKTDKTTTDNSAVAWSSGTLASTQHSLSAGSDALILKRNTGESIACSRALEARNRFTGIPLEDQSVRPRAQRMLRGRQRSR